MKLVIRALSLLIVITANISCKKSPFDPRNKYVGQWELTYDVHNYMSNEDYTYTKTQSVEAFDSDAGDWGIRIGDYSFLVNRDGNLYKIPQSSRDNCGTKVGEITKKSLTAEFNTSVTGPGVAGTITGKRVD